MAAPLKVPFHLVEARRQQLAVLLQQKSYLPIQEVCRRLNVSEATARRDLQALAEDKRIVRTFGGAVSDFNQRFTSFRERQALESVAKSLLATKSRELIQPGMTIFLDAGTTILAIAEEIRRQPVFPLQIVTNSLPVAEALAGLEGIGVHLLGGQVLQRQSVLLGPASCKALAFYSIDLALMSAQGADAAGIWNTQEQVVRLQKAALKQARHHVFCLDHTKIGHPAQAFLTAWSGVEMLLTDLSWPDLSPKIPIQPSQYLSGGGDAPSPIQPK